MSEKDIGHGLQYVVPALLAVLLVMVAFQTYQMSMLGSEISALDSEIKELDFELAVVRSSAGTSAATSTTGSSSSIIDNTETVSLQKIVAEITPTGTPDYGVEAGVSYDDIEGGLVTLMGYHASITLGGDDQQRYIRISTTPETACEFCCGIGGAGFGTSDGRVACGCSHNVAFSGLTKWLILNTDYTDEQIVDEIQNWKTLFFPQGMLERELEMRGSSPEAFDLPSMRGGC